jgi:hypothetical protein
MGQNSAAGITRSEEEITRVIKKKWRPSDAAESHVLSWNVDRMKVNDSVALQKCPLPRDRFRLEGHFPGQAFWREAIC